MRKPSAFFPQTWDLDPNAAVLEEQMCVFSFTRNQVYYMAGEQASSFKTNSRGMITFSTASVLSVAAHDSNLAGRITEMEHDITCWLFRFSYCTFLPIGKGALQTQHSFIPATTLVEVTKVSTGTTLGPPCFHLIKKTTKKQQTVAMAAWISLTWTSTGVCVFGLRECWGRHTYSQNWTNEIRVLSPRNTTPT